MATKKQSSTPSIFNFLKEGLLLPTRNPRLFTVVFSIIVASISLLLLGNFLILEHLTDELNLDMKALNSTNPSSQPQEYLHVLQKFQGDTRRIFLTSTAYHLFTFIIRSVVGVIVLFAAVATYSGELHNLGSLLRRARTQLKGPLLTLAFVYALQTVYVAVVVVLGAMAGVLYHLMSMKQYIIVLFFVVLLMVIVASLLFLLYFSILCSLSVVVAVAEPGCHGAGAMGRARRLMKGKLRRVILLIFVTIVLSAVIYPVYSHAKKRAVSNMASGLLLGFVYVILAAAMSLFADCAMTALYYECKGSTEASATEYIMVSTKQINDP